MKCWISTTISRKERRINARIGNLREEKRKRRQKFGKSMRIVRNDRTQFHQDFPPGENRKRNAGGHSNFPTFYGRVRGDRTLEFTLMLFSIDRSFNTHVWSANIRTDHCIVGVSSTTLAFRLSQRQNIRSFHRAWIPFIYIYIYSFIPKDFRDVRTLAASSRITKNNDTSAQTDSFWLIS